MLLGLVSVTFALFCDLRGLYLSKLFSILRLENRNTSLHDFLSRDCRRFARDGCYLYIYIYFTTSPHRGCLNYFGKYLDDGKKQPTPLYRPRWHNHNKNNVLGIDSTLC